MSDLIVREDAIRDIRLMDVCVIYDDMCSTEEAVEKAIVATKRNAIFGLECMNSAEPEIIRCKNCKYWKQQTNYIGVPLSFGFCENDNMWGLLYGETCEVSHIDTDDDFYCGYAERRTDE